MIPQDHGIKEAMDYQLLEQTKIALEEKKPVEISLPIRNIHRTVGALLSGRIAKYYGAEGLPESTIKINFTGSAGQSFGAFLSKGVTLTLEGDTNDYVGKGLSGGKIIIFSPKNSTFVPEDNSIVGNVVLYGATSGEAYFAGKAGERFAVRNSGATVVVESVGANGCEYMTNGIVIVLGKTGKNFAAGMSGGYAFVLDEDGEFSSKMCNTSMVDLDALNESDELLVHNLVKKHVELTGSQRGKKILDEWNTFKTKFVKVFPHDYKRVLNATQKAKEETTVVKSNGSGKEIVNG